MTRHLLLATLLSAAGFLPAQGTYRNANSPTDPICPRVDQDKTALNFGGSGNLGSTGGKIGGDSAVKLQYQQGSQAFPPGQRKSVAAFAAYDAKAKGTAVSSLAGKVVLVGLWSVRCDPSAKMLMEMASVYPKREQYGFEILAVNYDETTGEGSTGGWRAINTFMNKNRAFFEASKMPVYTPGLGQEGPSTFMDIVHSLPALFVIDREGNLAQVHIGYKEGYVGQALMGALREKPAPKPAAAPAPK